MLKTSICFILLAVALSSLAQTQNPKLSTVRLHIDGFSKSKSGAI